MNRPLFTRALAFTLVALLCGVPQVFAQTQQTTPPPEQQQAAPQPQQPNITADPAQGPVEPAQTTAQPDQQPPAETDPYVQKYGTLPNAPSASQPAQPAQSQLPAQSTSKPQEPAGTAAAGEAITVGGAASKPAGTAIAPAKQRQVRSLLIKLGAIAAAGAAVGIVYGLSKGTSSRPPGATTATTPTPAP
ncbi:MAG TPA: hypothetical protein VLA96_14660 [Terriglobales bacterium]|nr:hypothetical protein [Terriglobales bacterium]